MTDPRSGEELFFRTADERDGAGLRAFSCSRGALHEEEVRLFIRQSALTKALAADSIYRLLVALESDRIVAVAGHRPELLLVESADRSFSRHVATRLHVLALSLGDQGRRLADGRRLSDVVMHTLISDALNELDTGLLTAIVARENLRSIALCERHGFRSQVEYDSRHVRLGGNFTLRR